MNLNSIILFGNITKDIIHLHENYSRVMKESTGGSISFILPLINLFSKACEITIYCVGPENQLENFRHNKNIIINRIYEKDPTTFEIIYQKDLRSLKVLYKTNKISFEFFMNHLPTNEPEIILFCPVFHEFSEDLITEVSKYYKNSLITLDAQGLVRTTDLNGNITYLNWKPSQKLLKSIDILIISNEELSSGTLSLLRERKGKHIIITLGYFGSILISHKDKKNNNILVPAFPLKPKSIVDPTGAGDVFCFGISLYFYLSKSIVESLFFGNALARFHLSGKITSKFMTATQNEDDSLIKIVEKYIYEKKHPTKVLNTVDLSNFLQKKLD